MSVIVDVGVIKTSTNSKVRRFNDDKNIQEMRKILNVLKLWFINIFCGQNNVRKVDGGGLKKMEVFLGKRLLCTKSLVEADSRKFYYARSNDVIMEDMRVSYPVLNFFMCLLVVTLWVNSVHMQF